MLKEIVVTAISLLGILLSAVVSYLISKRNFEAELEKIKKQFTQKLFEKRLEAYPQLYEILSSFQKLIRSGKADDRSFEIFFEKYQEWNSRYGILLSPRTVVESHLFQEYVREVGWQKDKAFSELLPKMIRIEHSLKTELGIFESMDYHNPETINRKINEMIRERKLEILKEKSDSNSALKTGVAVKT